MQYSKKLQLKSERKKKKQKDLGRISTPVYNKVINRDKHKCVVCGSKTNLECHHITSRGKMGEGTPENLCMLCHNCHFNKLHGQGDFYTKIRVFEYMISIGYTEYKNELEKLVIRMQALGIRRKS